MRQGKLRTAVFAAVFSAASAAMLILRACTGTRYLVPALCGADFCLSFGLGLWVTLLVRCIRKKGRAAVIVPLCTAVAGAISVAAAVCIWCGGEYGGLLGAFALAFVSVPLIVSALIQYILLRSFERSSPPEQ
jgi:hypothetical protein